jgi:circadian clock protein KaiC
MTNSTEKRTRSTLELTHKSSTLRITSGNGDLDALCGGGFFRGSIILVSGATGTGKTLISSEFIGGGVVSGERCLWLGFEESRDQLFRNALGWGRDFAQSERKGLLRVSCRYPEALPIEEHLLYIKREIDELEPTRVALDGLSALERISTSQTFREFVVELTAYLRTREITGLLTATTSAILGGQLVTDAHVSSLTDSIVLLRYVELLSEMRRGITVLKMRGSPHDPHIREFSIDDMGMHIGEPFRNVSGILTGNPRQETAAEVGRAQRRFDTEA